MTDRLGKLNLTPPSQEKRLLPALISVLSTNDIVNMIAAGKPGDEFLIEGLRQRQSLITMATLGQRPLMSR